MDVTSSGPEPAPSGPMSLLARGTVVSMRGGTAKGLVADVLDHDGCVEVAAPALRGRPEPSEQSLHGTRAAEAVHSPVQEPTRLRTLDVLDLATAAGASRDAVRARADVAADRSARSPRTERDR